MKADVFLAIPNNPGLKKIQKSCIKNVRRKKTVESLLKLPIIHCTSFLRLKMGGVQHFVQGVEQFHGKYFPGLDLVPCCPMQYDV
jgi:hypothetical protein